MYNQTNLLKILETEAKREQELIQNLTLRKQKLPKGYLACKHGYFYRVVRFKDKVEQLVISQDYEDRDALIDELSEKRYISKVLPILISNLKCCQEFQNQFQIYDPITVREVLPAHYDNFDLATLMLEGDFDPLEWVAAPYPKNTAYPENLKYKSEGGLLTRSKAEADIATKLEQNGLHFRYEPILLLGKHTFSPDFCVLHPYCRREIYWEHFGSMDNPQYAMNTMEKLRVYAEHGYRLGDNLIMTWETLAAPLNFEHINDRIAAYFCDFY